MSRELTDKTYVIQTRYSGKIWVTEQEAKAVQKAIVNNDRYIIIGHTTLMVSDIASVVTAEQIRELQHEKQGDYKCKYGYWHSRGQQCGHAMMPSAASS